MSDLLMESVSKDEQMMTTIGQNSDYQSSIKAESSKCAVERVCVCDGEAGNWIKQYVSIIDVNVAVQCVYSLGYLLENKCYMSLEPKFLCLVCYLYHWVTAQGKTISVIYCSLLDHIRHGVRNHGIWFDSDVSFKQYSLYTSLLAQPGEEMEYKHTSQYTHSLSQHALRSSQKVFSLAASIYQTVYLVELFIYNLLT